MLSLGSIYLNILKYTDPDVHICLLAGGAGKRSIGPPAQGALPLYIPFEQDTATAQRQRTPAAQAEALAAVLWPGEAGWPRSCN